MEQLRQHDEDHRSDERPRHASEAAEQHDEQEEDRRLHRERVGTDEAGEMRVEAPTGSGEGCRQGEGDGTHPVGIEPDRLGGDLAVADGHERAAPRRALQVAGEQQAHNDGQRDHVVVERQRQLERSEPRPRDARDAAEALGERVPLDEAVLHDDAERDGHHRQVGPAHAQGGQRQHHAHRGAQHDGRGQPNPEAEAEPRGDDRRRIGPQGIEAGLAE